MAEKSLADHYEEYLKETNQPIPFRCSLSWLIGYEAFIEHVMWAGV